MKKSMRILKNTSFVLLVLISFLIYYFVNGYILRSQAFHLVPMHNLLVWLLLVVISLIIVVGDNGFLKLGGIIGVVLGTLSILFLFVDNRSEYEFVRNETDELLVEDYNGPFGRYIRIYHKENFFFTKYVNSIFVDEQYEYTYLIDDDIFILTKCTIVACQEVEIEFK